MVRLVSSVLVLQKLGKYCKTPTFFTHGNIETASVHNLFELHLNIYLAIGTVGRGWVLALIFTRGEFQSHRHRYWRKADGFFSPEVLDLPPARDQKPMAVGCIWHSGLQKC